MAERYVLSVREDEINRMVIFNEKQLRDLMKQYVGYYNNDRCHLSVGRDSPTGREIQNKPFKSEKIRVGLNYSSRSNYRAFSPGFFFGEPHL